jgi:Ca2+-binding RTX toxin-like protein
MSGNHNNNSQSGENSGSGSEGTDTLDGIVSGTSGDDSIGLAYMGDPQGDQVDNDDAIQAGFDPDSDIIDAGDGDDTVEAGHADDTVFAGSGSDLVYGEEGDDVLHGDSNAPAVSVRESFEWDKAPDPDGAGRIDEGDNLNSGFSQDTGSVVVDFSVLPSSDGNSSYTDRSLATEGIVTDGGEIDATSGMRSLLDSKDDSATYQLDFSDSVENVSFRLNDIDHDSVVMVQAFDAEGNAIEFDLTGGSDVTLLDTDAVTGNDTADSTGGNTSYYSLDQSVLVEIEGPVSSIVITHSQDGYYSSGIAITDVYFDATPMPDCGEPGDDTLIGGEGDDVIYGEEGDDSLEGGDGDDTIDGGAGENTMSGGDGDDDITGGDDADTITGGDGSDTVNGGGGDDVIETGGSDGIPDRGVPDYGFNTPIAPDGDPLDDRDVVDGGAGDDVISTGDDNDTITGGEGDDTIDGGLDDDSIDGGTGDDDITGGQGSDTVDGGEGDDVIDTSGGGVPLPDNGVP